MFGYESLMHINMGTGHLHGGGGDYYYNYEQENH